MKYKFTNNAYDIPRMLGVEILDKSIETLREIAWRGWTANEVQMIIDKSKALQKGSKFEYQVEGSDFMMSIYPDEVYFYSAYSNQETADFIWTFNEFIDFMENFKKIIEENK